MSDRVADYWRLVDAGLDYAAAWDSLSSAEKEEVTMVHKRRKMDFAAQLPFAFDVGELVYPLGKDNDRYYVVSRSREDHGSVVRDSYILSWDSPENRGENTAWDRILLFHDRGGYAQSHVAGRDCVSAVGIGISVQKFKVNGRTFRFVGVSEMRLDPPAPEKETT